MLYPVALFAILFIIAVSGPLNVRAETDRPPQELQFEEPLFQMPLFQTTPIKAAAPIQVRATGSSLAEIAKWLSTTYDLPYAGEPPRIERVPALRLYQLRHRAFLPSQGGSGFSTPPGQREVVAVYDDKTRTVYLSESWTGNTIADQSVLVHEMVHHLQNLSGRKYACPEEREKTAYLAQDEWLKAHGLELEKEFEVDLFTIVAMSACMG